MATNAPRKSGFAPCGGWRKSNGRRWGGFARSDAMAFVAEVSRPPSMTNSRSKRTRWCRLRSKPSTRSKIAIGANKRIWHSTGSSVATILGNPLYDTSTGGCHDGLQENRVNENQGAESTLAFLLSLAEMQLLENSVAAFQSPEPSLSKDHPEQVKTPSVIHAN